MASCSSNGFIFRNWNWEPKSVKHLLLPEQSQLRWRSVFRDRNGNSSCELFSLSLCFRSWKWASLSSRVKGRLSPQAVPSPDSGGSRELVFCLEFLWTRKWVPFIRRYTETRVSSARAPLNLSLGSLCNNSSRYFIFIDYKYQYLFSIILVTEIIQFLYLRSEWEGRNHT